MPGVLRWDSPARLLRLCLRRYRFARGKYWLAFQLVHRLLQLEVISRAEFEAWRQRVGVDLCHGLALVLGDGLHGRRGLALQERGIAWRTRSRRLQMMIEIGFAQAIGRVAPVVDRTGGL